MRDVPKPIQIPEADDSIGLYREVSAVGVELDASSQTVVMSLRDLHNERDLHYCLSVAAAERLSRRLHEKVEEYLDPGDDDQA